MDPIEDLKAWLAGLGRDELEHLLNFRPDVLRGTPVADLDDLADRLVHPYSAMGALVNLPTPSREVLEALVAMGAGARLERAVELLEPSGNDAATHRAVVESWLTALTRIALLWPGADHLRVNPGLLQVITSPLWLGRPVGVIVTDIGAKVLQKSIRAWGVEIPSRKADVVAVVEQLLADPARVRRLIGEAPEAVIGWLSDRATATAARIERSPATWGAFGGEDDEDPYAFDRQRYAAEREATVWLLEHGLAFSPMTSAVYGYSPYTVDAEIPAEVMLALMPPTFRAPFSAQPPALPTAPVALEQVESSASAAVTQYLAAAMATLEAISRRPLALLKSGGVGVRELTRVAKEAGVYATDVRVTVELGYRLRLLDVNDDERLGGAPQFEAWRRREPAERAADLLQRWFALEYAPSLDRDEEGRSRPALAPLGYANRTPTPVLVAGVLTDLDDGVGVVSPDDVFALLAWTSAMGHREPAEADAVWAEAERLGVVAHGRLTDAGRALFDEDRPALVETLRGMVPAVQASVLFGSDLTIVVPGSPAAGMVDLLDALAVREGHGVASTWRVSARSVRGALDAGHDVGDLLEDLRALSERDLPQALEYLLRDVGRKYGHLRVQAGAAVVLCDDEALIAEVEATRGLRKLGLRRVAPTVLVATASASASAEDVLAALRGAGFLPLALGAEGEPLVRLARVPDGGADEGAGPSPEEDLAAEDYPSGYTEQLLRGSAQESAADAAQRLL